MNKRAGTKYRKWNYKITDLPAIASTTNEIFLLLDLNPLKSKENLSGFIK